MTATMVRSGRPSTTNSRTTTSPTRGSTSSSRSTFITSFGRIPGTCPRGSNTRGNYTAFQDANTGVQALMDIYQMIGPDAMSRAYRSLYALQPPYGQPLSDQCKQVFIDQASDAVRAQVAVKVAAIVD